MTNIKIVTEKLWAKNKYEVMAKGYEHYLEVRTMLKQATTISDYALIYHKISTLREVPYKTKAMINTLEHIWGYFKKNASNEEKERFFQQLNDIRQVQIDSFTTLPEEVKKIFSFILQLLARYENDYLKNSTILFPDLIWNEVQQKKAFLISENTYQDVKFD
ncbi:YbgA family protein [Anaerobacillus sp. CMMVII]|uniref:YbgA family protein n=1 Tax=Anaerobacillus sp. CMMVII TaxID=2755588 RepID=UPI0021B7685F|nr:YbgA family protein [Anaerobacillus sp. CMMVII]MCT8138156.1 YbgA family protein [Anaerobacillus sp. CMMVII]